MTTTRSSKLIEYENWPEEFEPLSVPFHAELDSWRNTPYLLGAASKGYGVDCVRFCCAVVDKMFGYSRCPYEYLPQDTCFHDKEAALVAMRSLKTYYEPLETVSGAVQPGDLLVVGPSGGGPGHLMIVGPARLLWHVVVSHGPSATGLAVPNDFELFRKYRFSNRSEWVQRIS